MIAVNRDDIAQSTRCIVGHGGFLLLTWLRLASSSSAKFGSPIQLCETFPTSSWSEAKRRLRWPTPEERAAGGWRGFLEGRCGEQELRRAQTISSARIEPQPC